MSLLRRVGKQFSLCNCIFLRGETTEASSPNVSPVTRYNISHDALFIGRNLLLSSEFKVGGKKHHIGAVNQCLAKSRESKTVKTLFECVLFSFSSYYY